MPELHFKFKQSSELTSEHLIQINVADLRDLVQAAGIPDFDERSAEISMILRHIENRNSLERGTFKAELSVIEETEQDKLWAEHARKLLGRSGRP